MTHPSAAPSGQPHGWPYQQAYAPPQPPIPGGHPLARPGQRLAARLIDSAILTVPVLLLAGVLLVAAIMLVHGSGLSADSDEMVLLIIGVVLAMMVILSLISAATSYLYLVVYQVRSGSTVGKRAMKVRVIRLDGSPIDSASASRRWLAYEGVALLGMIPGVGMLTGVYTWVDALWLLWDKPLQQCLHDKYARTIVVTYEGTPA